MNKRTRVIPIVFALVFTVFLAACATPEPPAVVEAPGPGQATAAPGDAAAAVVGGIAPMPASPADFSVDPNDPRLAEHGLDENLRFLDTRTITVGLWDRANDRVPDFALSYWAEWVQAQILQDHNINVEWVTIPRWTEGEFQSTLLAAGTAPDIGYTFNNPMVTTMAGMGGIINQYPLLNQYRDLLPNLYDLLQENVYWNLDPTTQELWSLTGRLIQDGRIVTFIREDWLNTLNLPIPTTLQEFENTLIAFRDNAELLLGANAHNMIPFRLEHDTGWSSGLIIESFIPSNVTEREWFVRGFDDRRFMWEEPVRETTRVLNRWFHEDLLWNDFFLHEPGDPIGDDQVRLGFVGSFIVNWDMPFRGADQLTTMMQENVGPEANWIPITPFVNDAGQVRKFFPNPTDRFIFFPVTNQEPLASLLYLDWISRVDVREFLAFGIEGVHRYTLADGGIALLAEEEGVHAWPDNQFIPSLRNFDITMTVNGIDLGDPYLSVATLATGYPGIPPAAVMAARNAGLDNAYWFRQVQTRVIAAEEGMSTPLAFERDFIFHQLVANTAMADFDAAFDSLYGNYLAMGAQAIMDERNQAWIEQFGDVDTMP
ncbi:MAG: sugar ABC transporter substrate-binding protein [Defluviitaleaceae bacterium]|nr:sugar ABC transporter substrate-binding protein [Defluviitaleaceae bacterium]